MLLVVDGHCDTLSRILEDGGSILVNNYHCDVERMLKFDAFVQFFACFVPPEIEYESAFTYTSELIDIFNRQSELHNDVMTLCKDCNDIDNAVINKRVASLLSIENGTALQGNLQNVSKFYKSGVRSICLTWNNDNDISGGCGGSGWAGGLTAFGRTVVEEMNRLGMLVDVSHISEQGFWDVVDISIRPIIASHSNAKKICNHPRNLSDGQISAIAESGGIVGINLCPDFLGPKPGIGSIIMNIEHIASVAGEDHVGFGCDFDGVSSLPYGISGVQDMDIIIDNLLKLNYPENTVKKICGMNFLRVIRDVLG